MRIKFEWSQSWEDEFTWDLWKRLKKLDVELTNGCTDHPGYQYVGEYPTTQKVLATIKRRCV